nr:10020_t:CDS:2 [Entrophospora candida]
MGNHNTKNTSKGSHSYASSSSFTSTTLAITTSPPSSTIKRPLLRPMKSLNLSLLSSLKSSPLSPSSLQVKRPSLPTFRYVEGRRYQNFVGENIRYQMPDDNEEHDRLQRQHFLFRYLWKSNFSSPMEDLLKRGNCKTLDIGCGPGAWLMECANDYPRSDFVGIDVVASFPTQIKPRNTTFVQGNVLNGLPFEDETFDFVHMRLMVGAFSEQEWINNVIPDLKWYKCGPLSNRIITGLNKFTESRGAIGIVTPIIQRALQNNPSLTNYHSIYKDLNFGSWAGRLGEIATEEYLVRSLHGLPELAPIIGVSQKEYKQILDNRLSDEMTENKTYTKNHRIFANKI